IDTGQIVDLLTAAVIEGRRQTDDASELDRRREVQLDFWKRNPLITRRISDGELTRRLSKAVGTPDHAIFVRVVHGRNRANVIRTEGQTCLEDLRVIEAAGELRDLVALLVAAEVDKSIGRPRTVDAEICLDAVRIPERRANDHLVTVVPNFAEISELI